MNARELVAGAVALGDGSITGRVRLQKVMYLLMQNGLNGPFRFAYHHYGPFSRDVDEAISDAKAFCGLREETMHRESDGAPFSVFRLSASPDPHRFTTLGEIAVDNARAQISLMKSVTSTVIEVAATVFWLRFEERVPDWRSELSRRKGAKAAPIRVEQALTLLHQLGLESGPAPAVK